MPYGHCANTLRSKQVSTVLQCLCRVYKQWKHTFVVQNFLFPETLEGGDVAQLVECWIGTHLMQVQFPSAARVFLPESSVSEDSLKVPIYPHVCVHVKDSVVHVGVQWIMETLQHSMHFRLGSTTVALSLIHI